MSVWKQLLISLCIGTAIGIAVPMVTNSFSSVPLQAPSTVDIITETEQQPVDYQFIFTENQ